MKPRKITVKKVGRTYGVFMNTVFVPAGNAPLEGGFFSREKAEEKAEEYRRYYRSLDLKAAQGGFKKVDFRAGYSKDS